MGVVPEVASEDIDILRFRPRSTVDWSVSLVAFFSFLLPIYRYATYWLSGHEFVHDAQVWVSVGESVLHGQALYASVADNKPPVWEGIAILVSITPRPYLVLLLVVGANSALLVVLVAQLAKQFVSDQAAVVAAVLVGFGLLQSTNGFINNKTLALACLLAGLLAQREVAPDLDTR